MSNVPSILEAHKIYFVTCYHDSSDSGTTCMKQKFYDVTFGPLIFEIGKPLVTSVQEKQARWSS